MSAPETPAEAGTAVAGNLPMARNLDMRISSARLALDRARLRLSRLRGQRDEGDAA